MTASPPGPPGTWLGGHLHELRRDRLAFFRRCARDYGDVVGLRFGHRSIYLVSHPDLIEEVLLRQAKSFRKHFALRLTPSVLGKGLLTSEGEFWLRQRRLIQPAFARARLHGHASVMLDAVERMLARWQPGTVRSIRTEMMALTLEIAARTLFGADPEDDASKVAEAMEVVQDTFITRFDRVFSWPLWVPTPANLRFKAAVRRLDEIVFRFIRQRRESPGEGRDLLSVLLAARDEDGSGRMTDEQVRDEAMTLFLAGHETTALVLTWAWVLLAQHPAILEKLYAEVDGVLGSRPPSAEDVARLPYTEAILQESMRLYPPAYVIGREAIAPCEIGGYPVPTGQTILLSEWVVHRDERWFPEPETFRPERWLDGSTANLPKFAYFPFGGGPRICIGNSFAMLETVLILSRIAQRYQLTQPAVQPTPKPSFTLRPSTGVEVELLPREGSRTGI